MMLRSLPFVVFFSAFLGTSAYADTGDQAALDGYFALWSGPKGLNTLRHLASCVVERHPAAAQAFVREVGTSAELSAKSDQLIDKKCIKKFFFRNSTTKISPPTYLPLLAENLLKQGYVAGQLPSVTDVAPLDHPSLPQVPLDSVDPRYRNSFVIDKAANQLEMAAECVARAEPAKVFQLANAEPGSAAEKEMLMALDGAMATCGWDQLTYTFPTFAVRGALVMNLYRLVDAARPVTRQEVGPNA